MASYPNPILFLVVTLGACVGGDICTASVEPSIVITIRDAVSQVPLAAAAQGTAEQRGGIGKGGITLPLLPSGFMDGVMVSRRAGEELSGVFTVRVEHAGYLPWERNGVQVPDLGCHVGTVLLTADLIPEISAAIR